MKKPGCWKSKDEVVKLALFRRCANELFRAYQKAAGGVPCLKKSHLFVREKLVKDAFVKRSRPILWRLVEKLFRECRFSPVPRTRPVYEYRQGRRRKVGTRKWFCRPLPKAKRSS